MRPSPQGNTTRTSPPTAPRVEKQIAEQGFRCKRAEIADYKRILTRYFGWNLPEGEIETTEGETAARKWFLPDGEVVG